MNETQKRLTKLMLLCLMLLQLGNCSHKVSCGNQTTSFLGVKFNNPIPQRCEDRPNRSTKIVGW
jgi:hypothetical protein